MSGPRTHAPAQGEYHRVLAVKLADLGDLLTVTPALQALHSAHPRAEIDLLVPPSSASLLRGAPYINRVLTFDKFAFDSLSGLLNPARVPATLRFLAGLRLARYDALVLFHHFTSSWGAVKFAALSLASGARVRAGVDNGRGWFLNRRFPDSGFGAMHEADYWLRAAALLGADPSLPWRPSMPVDQASRTAARALLSSEGINRANPVVAIHPGAGWYSKARIWPIGGFAAVARGLIASHDATIIVVGGPDEMELGRAMVSLVGKGTRVINLAGRASIHETAAVIEGCSLFVGNDSGPMHMAVAVGTPVVAVFGPSNKDAWGPYTPPGEREQNTTVSRRLPCMPCFYRGHSLGLREGCGTRECLTLLPHGPVLAACRHALERAAEDGRSEIQPQTQPEVTYRGS